MNDDTLIPMDDPTIKEVLADLARKITEQDVKAVERSLKLRGLRDEWLRQCGSVPVIDMEWQEWFEALATRNIPVSPSLALLADAGVLGTAWFLPARDRVFDERGWR